MRLGRRLKRGEKKSMLEKIIAIKNVNQSLLKEVVPVDVFESKELKDEKSVLFKLYFQNPKKTLEDNEVNSIIAEIIDIVLKKFNAKLREQ